MLVEFIIQALLVASAQLPAVAITPATISLATEMISFVASITSLLVVLIPFMPKNEPNRPARSPETSRQNADTPPLEERQRQSPKKGRGKEAGEHRKRGG